ncbi:MAG: hypothetical protein U0931_14405 [Vulcanimicrobiota bacterium]
MRLVEIFGQQFVEQAGAQALEVLLLAGQLSLKLTDGREFVLISSQQMLPDLSPARSLARCLAECSGIRLTDSP